jgi:ActD protein
MAGRSRIVPGVLASFEHIDAATDAIKALRAGGHKDLVVYCSHPNHELEEALEAPVSPVRLFTLIGGLTGTTAATAMTIWMNLDWPTLVGGKAIAAIPAFVAIMFELTVLIGGLASVAGVIILVLMGTRRGVMYDPRFSDDRIGVFVPAAAEGAPAVERLFRDAGAVEVRHAVP